MSQAITVAEGREISIHAPTRGATDHRRRHDQHCKFQSTLPQGERQCTVQYYNIFHNFNPRSHKGSDIAYVYIAAGKTFQSTLPQGERRRSQTTCTERSEISIHAPTRGATCLAFGKRAEFIISIHAPTRGATSCSLKARAMSLFQSTLPQGERLMRDQPYT